MRLAVQRALLTQQHAYRYFAGWTDKLNGEVMQTEKCYHSYTVREPIGVLAAMSPDWIRRPPREKMRSISWTPAAEEHLRKLLPLLRFYDDLKDIRAAIEEVACEDPRSTHWKVHSYCV